jgi:hypothetical protein
MLPCWNDSIDARRRSNSPAEASSNNAERQRAVFPRRAWEQGVGRPERPIEPPQGRFF